MDYLEKYRGIALSRGGRLLSVKWLGSSIKHEWVCEKEHTWWARPSNIGPGGWCPTCNKVRERLKKLANNFDSARLLAEAKGGRCLALANFSTHECVEWECAKKHTWFARYGDIKRGTWCRKCVGEALRTERIHDNLAIAKSIAKAHHGYCLTTVNFATYENVSWRCSKGHEWTAMFTNVQRGRWCSKCRHKSETYYHDVLRALFPNYQFERNIRKLPWLGVGVGGRPLELDMYCEELALALEFNGFLHDKPVEAFGGLKLYARIREHDMRKVDACLRNNVCLLTVTTKEISKNGINPDLGLVANKIWTLVSDLGFTGGEHLRCIEDLMSALSL